MPEHVAALHAEERSFFTAEPERDSQENTAGTNFHRSLKGVWDMIADMIETDKGRHPAIQAADMLVWATSRELLFEERLFRDLQQG